MPDRAVWRKLHENIDLLIAALSFPEETKHALRENIGALNRVPHKEKMKAILKQINITLGAAEELAWKRRDDAEHGNAMQPEKSLL